VVLPPSDERALSEQHDAALARMVPVWAPLFGLAVILFGIWDYWIDPSKAAITVPIRLGLVAISFPAYRRGPFTWTAVQRCAYVYATHVSAMIVCASLLRDGLLYGLAGITASVFLVALVALQWRTFALILLLPSLIFIFLGVLRMSLRGFANALVLYVFSVALAGVMMTLISSFRRRAYLFEKELLHASRHDSLSGALNRSYLTELAVREVALAKRHRRPLAVAMLDIDHFKRVNDTYGHAVGDVVIQRLVTTCNRTRRATDYFGRIGGEEFACVMPETDANEALRCAERMRISLEALCTDTQQQGPVRFTVSIGVAVLDDSHADWPALLAGADSALYRAKETGRNRTVLAAPARQRNMAS
jgi:diguanylate cyclase (GGDEF)-like protein